MPPLRWTELLLALLAASLAAFLAMGWDKAQAVRGGRRVPEAWLLGLGLALGFPGLWCGVRLFRHKTRKPSFLWRLGAVSAIDLALLGAGLWRAGLPS